MGRFILIFFVIVFFFWIITLKYADKIGDFVLKNIIDPILNIFK